MKIVIISQYTRNTKLARLAGITYRLGRSFDKQAATMFYYAFVYPIISYGIVAWGGHLMIYSCPKTHRLFRRIIKNLFKPHFFNLSADEIVVNLGILSLKNLYIMKLMELYYNVRHLDSYPHLNLNIQRNICTQYNFRKIGELEVPFPRINSLKCNYKYQITSVWNDLPRRVRDAPTLKVFKSQLKNHLLYKC